MDPKEQLEQAKHLLDLMGGDPQVALTAIRIAKSVDDDPQRVMALLAIAKFINTQE